MEGVVLAIKIAAIGGVLLIIGFWAGYLYRGLHHSELTPEERDRILKAHIEAHGKDHPKMMNDHLIPIFPPSPGLEFTIDEAGKFEKPIRIQILDDLAEADPEKILAIYNKLVESGLLGPSKEHEPKKPFGGDPQEPHDAP